MPTIEVRRATFDDMPGLMIVAEESTFQSAKELGVEALIAHVRSRKALVAVGNGLLVGSLLFNSGTRPPFTESIDVLPYFRGNAAGRTLMAGLELIAIQEGHDIIYSSTDSDNVEARAFHQALGFTMDGYISSGDPPSISVVLSKWVDPPIAIPDTAKLSI